MPPPDQGGGSASPPTPALRRQMSCTCSHDKPAVQLERRLSCSSAAFSSPAASPASSSASTTYHPASSSNKSSCESMPFADPALLDTHSPISSSYGSFFFHVDHDFSQSPYLDFEPTRAPAVQDMATTTMERSYDPKRLPSSMFRTRSTNPAEWSVFSNESLFSIRLSNSGDDDRYYDAAGFPRFPSMGGSSNSNTMHSFSEESSNGTAGGLCRREDCARCSAATRKSVRFAATTETVYGGSNHTAASPAVCRHANAHESSSSTAKTSETKQRGGASSGAAGRRCRRCGGLAAMRGIAIVAGAERSRA